MIIGPERKSPGAISGMVEFKYSTYVTRKVFLPSSMSTFCCFGFAIMSKMATDISRLGFHSLEDTMGSETLFFDAFGKRHNSGSPALVPHFKSVAIIRGVCFSGLSETTPALGVWDSHTLNHGDWDKRVAFQRKTRMLLLRKEGKECVSMATSFQPHLWHRAHTLYYSSLKGMLVI